MIIDELKKYMLEYGYNNLDIEKAIAYSEIIRLKYETLFLHIKDFDSLCEFGYSRKDIIKMTNSFIPLFGLNIESLKQRIKDLKTLGYSQNNVVKMTKQLPSIYSYSIENIKQKIELYRLMNISHILVEKATYLMQSCELSFARYMFYKNKGIIIDENNYPKLFIDQLKFKRLYGIDNKTLIQMYNYDEYFSKEKNVLIKI